MAEAKHRSLVPSGTRRNDVFVSPELLITERKKHGPSATDCIDLTAYEDMKDERESTLMSTISDLKIDERSTSNCENEAAVAVNNIKTLLDLGDNDEMMFGPMIHRNRNETTTSANPTTAATNTVRKHRSADHNHQHRHHHDTQFRQSSTPPETPTTTGNHHHQDDDGPIRLWSSDEPPRPEQYHSPQQQQQQQRHHHHHHKPPKSEYHLAKERLMTARRQKNSIRKAESDANDILLLTQKHDALVRKSTEFRSSSNGALIEVIHIENDQIVVPPPSSSIPPSSSSPPPPPPLSSASPPLSPKSLMNRLFIDTSEMEQTLDDITPHSRRSNYEGNDLVSAFGYEFKRRENDEQSDIIVIDDVVTSEKDQMSDAKRETLTAIAGQNVAARYEAIRNSVAGRISSMERTQIHPLLPVPEVKQNVVEKPRDLSPSKIHFIRDQVKSLQEQQQQIDEVNTQPSEIKIEEDVQLGNVNEEKKLMLSMEESNVEDQQSLPSEAMIRSPSRASAIEGLIAANNQNETSKQDPSTLDDDSEAAPLRAEAAYRKKSKASNSTSPLPKMANYDDNGKVESDFIAITRNLSSKTFMTDLFTESSSVHPSTANNNSNDPDPQNEATSDKFLQAADVESRLDDVTTLTSKAIANLLDTDSVSFVMIKKESPVLITAAELCVGFCANNGDTISLPDEVTQMTFDRNHVTTKTLSPVNSVGSAGDRTSSTIENIDAIGIDSTAKFTVEPQKETIVTTEQTQTASVAHVNLAKSKSKEERKDSRINDLALSDDESSESYPSDVEVDDDDELKYMNKAKFITADSIKMEKYTNTVDTKTLSSKSVVSTATESHVKQNTEASISDNASFVSDNSGTRESLGDSDNSESDDEDTGIYDACFARQIFDDTCAWLERDETSFCFRPSLLKKVKRQNVGHMKKYYGRSPLVLRVPRNPIITRNYLQSRRKVQENPVIRSRKSKQIANSNVKSSESQSTVLRFRQNQNIFGVHECPQKDGIAKGTTHQKLKADKMEVTAKTHEDVEDFVTPISSNISKATDTTTHDATETHTNEYSVAESSGVFEADSKNLAIFEVKSAEEYTSHHFSTYQKSLRSRSMSPVSISKKISASKHNDAIHPPNHSDVIVAISSKIESSRSREQETLSKPIVEESTVKQEPIDCTGTKAESEVSSLQWIESPDAPGFDEYVDEEYSGRPKSRREGLAKLRHHKSPVRHELIQLEHVESEMESTDNSALNEEQRLAALDMAEKLRRRAMTLRRRRKLRDRRREVRCMDSQMVAT